MSIVPLSAAEDAEEFGGKAVQLGAALRAGLTVPGGFALSWRAVDEIATGSVPDCPWPSPCAVRSSAIGEDSDGASFAGTHLSVLGVCGDTAVAEAIAAVRASGQEAGAVAYRDRMGLEATARMGVVVQELIDAEAAGVLFTRNPVTGADEIVIEATWGLGEAVVAGLVTPDHFVMDADGTLIAQTVGEKDLAIRRHPDGHTHEVDVAPDLQDVPCLGPSDLAALVALVRDCDRVFGTEAHDIEFAVHTGAVYLLQRRPITHG